MEDIPDCTKAVPRVRDGVRLVIENGHHRHAAIAELLNDPAKRQAWAWGPIEMYLTGPKDGTVMRRWRLRRA